MQAGQTLLHYCLIEKIGEGGMGVIWKAEDTKLHRNVALKILPESMASDPERRARFEREARAVAALNHSNIVTLYSVEEAPVVPPTGSEPGDSVHFITMELIEGQTLTERLPNNGFPLNRLLEIAIPLADAVSSAHRAGITHRDLKPDNIMFDGEGRLRVLDFGLAKLTDPAGPVSDTETATVTPDTVEGKILGTVAYMSPEQAEGKPVDLRSDIFSLGTILYEMAGGKRPFQGDTGMSTIGAILKDEPDSIIELKPSLPRHIGRILRRCLAKSPDRRYQTALDLRNELEDLKHEVASGEHELTVGTGTARPGSSLKRWGATGIGTIMVLLVVWAVRQWPESTTPPSQYASVPVTSVIGQDSGITWSPEGEFIAFGRVRNGSSDIMVQPVAGGEATVRAGGAGDQVDPHWSPDGKFLAYISSLDPASFVYLVPPHGGTPRRLIETNIPTLDVDLMTGAMGGHPWSADGRHLLVSRVIESGQMAIHLVDRKDGDAVRLCDPPRAADDLSSSFSIDGDHIVFERRRDGRGALMMMSVAGGEPEVLLEDKYDNTMPSFRPDGRHILFLSDRGGIASLWEFNLDTGDTRQLWFESFRIIDFAVSPANRILYVPFWHDTFLFAVDIATGERRQLTSHTKDNNGARFSPDGQTIAYHSTREGNCEIFLHHLDGSPETRITDDPGWDLYPDWSPDGRQLIFNSNRGGGRYRIRIANSDGGYARWLSDQSVSISRTQYPVNAGLVSRWSPDGERIAYLVTTEEDISLWSVQPDGEDAKQMIRDVVSFNWYLDSRRGIFTRPHDGHSELVAVNFDTGEERSLFTGPFMEMEVAPDGSALSFCYGTGHMEMGLAVLKLEVPESPDGLPRSLGEPEYVVRTDVTWHVHNGGWSPDSNTLVYTQDQDYGDIYKLVEK